MCLRCHRVDTYCRAELRPGPQPLAARKWLLIDAGTIFWTLDLCRDVAAANRRKGNRAATVLALVVLGMVGLLRGPCDFENLADDVSLFRTSMVGSPVGARLIETEAAESISRQLISLVDSSAEPVDRVTNELPVAQSVVIFFGPAGRMEVTHQGIGLSRGRHIQWQEVRWFRLMRGEHGSTYIDRVEICQSHGEILSVGVNWVRIDGKLQWDKVRRDAQWPKQLTSLVPADRWQFFRTDGELESLAEGEFRIDYWQRKQTFAKRIMYFAAPLMLVLGCIAPGTKIVDFWNAQFFPPVWKVVAMVCLILCATQPAVMTVAIAAYGQKASSRRIRKAREAVEMWHAGGPQQT